MLLAICLGVVGVLGIAAFVLAGVLLYRRRQRRKGGAGVGKQETKGVVGGRDSDGSFEMGPAGKYVSLE